MAGLEAAGPFPSTLLEFRRKRIVPGTLVAPRAHSPPQTAFWKASGSDRISGYFSLSYSIGDPKGSMPCANTVFGNSPEPQIVNDPKSLYQPPSGAHGPVFTQSCNRRRSCCEI